MSPSLNKFNLKTMVSSKNTELKLASIGQEIMQAVQQGLFPTASITQSQYTNAPALNGLGSIMVISSTITSQHHVQHPPVPKACIAAQAVAAIDSMYRLL